MNGLLILNNKIKIIESYTENPICSKIAIKMKLHTGLFSIIIITLLIIIFTPAIVSKFWKDYQVEQDQQKMQAMFSQILDGVSTEPPVININYKNQISTGSPLIFGGSHAPEANQIDAWEQIKDVGVTMIRKDLFIERTLPGNIKIEDYKNNLGDIQNVENWDLANIERTETYFKNAKERGMKTIAIVDYTPKWLTHNGTSNGVPLDWEVYEDIVAKSYKLYRNNIDYVEVWNEPNYKVFFNTDNSGRTVEQAYADLYYHTVKAVRKIDSEANDGKIVPIGGPAGYDPMSVSILDKLLKDQRTSESLQFVSYHNYEHGHLKEPSWGNYKKILDKYNKNHIPFFITEWNYEPDSTVKSDLNTTDKAITFTGGKFIDYLKMGLDGANYHVLEELNLMSPNEGEGYMGFYRFRNNKAELLPQSKTWRLMSNKMKLGKGESSIYLFDTDNIEISGVGFKNIDGQYGTVISNKSSNSYLTKINLNNLAISKYAKVEIYYASADNDAVEPIYSGEIKQEKDSMNLLVYLPKEAVIGVLLSEEKTWFDFVNLPY